jgi:hypothetical protein
LRLIELMLMVTEEINTWAFPFCLHQDICKLR